MRITAGKYKGRFVSFPKGRLATRPAMSIMRESLFNLLGPIQNTKWADVFCGSGLIGLEAFSRGAKLVHFVDMDKAKKPFLLLNLKWVEEEYKIFFTNAFFFKKKSRILRLYLSRSTF